MATAARRAAWKRQRADTQESQLKKAVRRENTRFHGVYNEAYEMFLERYVKDMEEDCASVIRGGSSSASNP